MCSGTCFSIFAPGVPGLGLYLKEYAWLKLISFANDKVSSKSWSVSPGKPIIKSEVQNLLGNVNGVLSVVNVYFENKYDSNAGYSGNAYDLASATRNGVIYPSLDPSIFEVKFPNQDIRGRVVSS